MKELIFSISLVALLIHPATSKAFTPQELKLSPNYCQDKLTFKGKNKSYWRSIFGEHWAHMHHYCGAIVWYSKALMAPLGSKGQNGRGFFLTETINNLNYSIRSATTRAASTPSAATWPLLPNAYYKRAKALEAQGQNSNAMQDYQRAINLKKNFALAYAAISDLFKKLGDIKNSKKYIEEGLKHSPNSKALKRRKAKLNSGK